MVKSDGKNRIDSIAVFHLNFASRGDLPGGGLEAKFVLQNSQNGMKFGSGTFTMWSDETSTKFNELLKSMEQDICSAVFESGTTTNSAEESETPLEDEVPGL